MRGAGALILVLSCSSPEAPAPSPVQKTTATNAAKPAPPSPPRVWFATLMTSGGLRGGVRVNAVRSDGATLRCSPEAQAAVSSAVAAAHPEGWKPHYALPKWSGLTDQFHYVMTLKVDDKTYQTEWDTEAGGLLPADAGNLYHALSAAYFELAKRCPAPPPTPPRVWRASMLISGGEAGGMRAVTVTSDGRSLRCSPQAKASVTSAVAEAHPETWQKGYAPAQPSRLTDQFHYSLTLKADETMYQVGWSSEGHGLLPPDLRALADALIVAQREGNKRCP
jgi:hypothetical protein